MNNETVSLKIVLYFITQSDLIIMYIIYCLILSFLVLTLWHPSFLTHPSPSRSLTRGLSPRLRILCSHFLEDIDDINIMSVVHDEF